MRTFISRTTPYSKAARPPQDFAEEPAIVPGTLAQLKAQMAYRRRKLLDPNYGHHPLFPIWSEGMTTHEYVAKFQKANAGTKPLEFIYARRTP